MAGRGQTTAANCNVAPAAMFSQEKATAAPEHNLAIEKGAGTHNSPRD